VWQPWCKTARQPLKLLRDSLLLFRIATVAKQCGSLGVKLHGSR